MQRLTSYLTIGLLSLILLSGCSLFKLQPDTVPELALIAPSSAMPKELLKQALTLETKEQTQTFITLVKIASEDTTLIALAPTGQIFLTQSYDGKTWHSKNLSGHPLPEREIFAMMQFSLWPDQAIKHAYQKPQWEVHLTPKKRQVYFNGRLYMTVDIDQNTIKVKHVLGHYSVIIKTFEKEPLSP